MNLIFDDDFDPNHRELCDDGICIGVVGPDGCCRECGKPAKSTTVNPRNRGLRTTQEVQEQVRVLSPGELEPAPPAYDDRTLCPNGECIGILGRDGRCSACGAQQ